MGWPRTDIEHVESVDLREWPKMELLYDSAAGTEEDAIAQFMDWLAVVNVMTKKDLPIPMAVGIERPPETTSCPGCANEANWGTPDYENHVCGTPRLVRP